MISVADRNMKVFKLKVFGFIVLAILNKTTKTQEWEGTICMVSFAIVASVSEYFFHNNLQYNSSYNSTF